MLCLCYFLSSSFIIIFFNDRLEQRDLGNYKTELHQIFSGGRHVGVCSIWFGFAIGQGTLSWQPTLGAKSAEIGDTPSFLGIAFHNDGRMGQRMSGLTAQMS